MTGSTRSQQGALRAAALLALTGLVSRHAVAGSAKLLVFLHVPLKQRAFQSELQAALPTLEVKTVGRLADFERGLSEGHDAVMSLPVLLKSHGLLPRLQGMRSGAPDEKYSLVANGAVPNPKRVASVGVLDLFGRDATNAFVFEVLGQKPKVERVTKFEDLLPLLQMQRVDSILLPTRLLADVQAASRLALAHQILPSLVRLPAVASAGAGGDSAVAAVAKMPEKVSRSMGVDAWR